MLQVPCISTHEKKLIKLLPASVIIYVHFLHFLHVICSHMVVQLYNGMTSMCPKIDGEIGVYWKKFKIPTCCIWIHNEVHVSVFFPWYPTNVICTYSSFNTFTSMSNMFVIQTLDNIFLSIVARLMPLMHLTRHRQTIMGCIYWGHLMSTSCIWQAITNNFQKLFYVATIAQPKAIKEHWT